MNKVFEFLKKRYLLFIGIGALVLLVFIFPLIEKKGTFSLEDEEPLLKFECPEVIPVDSEVACNLLINVSDNIEDITGISATYAFDPVFEFVSFVPETYRFPAVVGETRKATITLADLEATTGLDLRTSISGTWEETYIKLGTLNLTISEEAELNTEYQVDFTNVIVTRYVKPETAGAGGTYENSPYEDLTNTIRTSNDVATLDGITVENGIFDKEFDSFVFEYKVTVPATVSVAELEFIKSDVHSEVAVEGTTELHYGTNEITINVTSENGNVEGTYKLNIYREYNFSSEKYEYNEDENYIYVGSDEDATIAGKLDELEDDLYYEMDYGHLYVVYGSERLVDINVIRFNSKYTIAEKIIYVDDNFTYEGITNNITADGVDLVFLDADDYEITADSGEFTNGAKMDVYRQGHKLDSYTFKQEYFKLNGYNYDNEAMMITRLTAGMTYSEFLSNIQTSGSVEIEPVDESVVDGDDVIKTGDRLVIELTDTTYTYVLSVLGDINGDGIIEINDVGRLYKFYNDRLDLTTEQFLAGEITADGIVEINDVGRLYKFYNNKIPTLELEIEVEGEEE